jgi:hypothetical protein
VDLEENLTRLEAEVEEEIAKFNEQGMHENDHDRDSTYGLAAQLNAYIENMEARLEEVVGDFNQSRGGTLEEGDAAIGDMNPAEMIVHILNNHHDSLSWLDSQSREIARELSKLTLQQQR